MSDKAILYNNSFATRKHKDFSLFLGCKKAPPQYFDLFLKAFCKNRVQFSKFI